MTTFLLDANVLIALTAREHVHHERATLWASGIQRFAVCPVVEGALMRFAIRLGVSAAEVRESLVLLRRHSKCEFWPDSLSYADVEMGHVHGHRQVTDAYLVSAARSRQDARLATLDEALASALPTWTLLVPEL